VGDAFKQTGHDLLSTLDQTASQLLAQATSSAGTLLSQGAQSLISHLQEQKLPDGTSVSASTRNIGLLQRVDGFKNEAVKMLQLGEQQLKAVLSTALASFNQILDKVRNLEVSPDTVVAAIDKLTGAHNQLLDMFLTDLVTSTDSLVAKYFSSNKRSSVGDFFNNLGSSLASAFKPVVDTVKGMVSSTGTALQSSATGFLNAAKDSASQLGQKLTPHVQTLQGHAQTLVQHGSNALDALKAATADILQQTMENMKPTLNQMGQTLAAAGQTAVQHFANQLSNSTGPSQ